MVKNSTVNILLSNHFKGLTMHACLLAFFFSKQGNLTVAQFFPICWILIENTFSQRHDNNKDTRISELLIYIIELKNQFSMNYSYLLKAKLCQQNPVLRHVLNHSWKVLL